MGDFSNFHVRRSSSLAAFGKPSTGGIFDITVSDLGAVIVTSNSAFTAGSSQQGRQRLASVASNCVTAMYFSLPFTVYLLL